MIRFVVSLVWSLVAMPVALIMRAIGLRSRAVTGTMWKKERISEEYVYGVTHDGRQKLIAHCRVGDPMEFVREPNNPVDPLAVKVLVRGRHIGYFSEELADKFAKGMDRGELRFEGVVKAIEPFKRDGKKWLGIRFELHRFRRPAMTVFVQEASTSRSQVGHFGSELELPESLRNIAPTDDGFPTFTPTDEWRAPVATSRSSGCLVLLLIVVIAVLGVLMALRG